MIDNFSFIYEIFDYHIVISLAYLVDSITICFNSLQIKDSDYLILSSNENSITQNIMKSKGV